MTGDSGSERVEPAASEGVYLDDVRAAVARADWHQAAELLRDTGPERSAARLELAAQVAYGAGDLEGTLTALEELHRLRLEEGDDVGAAYAAALVAMYVMMDTGLMAPVRGWLRRAEHLLDDAGETYVDAWLAMVRTYERLLSGDLPAAASAACRAIELGMRHAVPPAVALGRVATARVELFEQRIDEGLDMLDEVAVMLMTGELDALTTGMVYCELICAMQGLAQFDRAEQWTQAMEGWRRGRAFGGINGRCRVHRAEILKLRGPCDAAEAEALRACDELRPWMRREFGWPLTELGNIRLRKGDFAGAEEAFLAAQEHLWEPQPGLALLRLAEGDVATASQLIRDALDRPLAIPSKEQPPFGALRRAPLLDAQVEIALAAGDEACARAAAEELSEIAREFRSAALSAAAALARARVALARGDVDDALRESTAAAASWTDIGAPYEAARARMVLAGAYAASGKTEAAHLERRAAHSTLERLGAHTATPARVAPREASEPKIEARACVFRREGAVREVVFDGLTARLPDLKGMRYLEILFAHPGREFHVLDLAARAAGSGAYDGDDGTCLTLGNEIGPLLDDTARDAYRRRLVEIEEDIEEATRHHDRERRALAEADREYLVRELARSFGLGGRPRRVGSPSERARSAVTRTIGYAAARLAEHHPALGEHLRRTLRTGTYVSYEPEPLAAIHWQVTPTQ